jgi:hypothetical protein
MAQRKPDRGTQPALQSVSFSANCEAQVFAGFGGTAEAVPFPEPL